MKGHLERLQEVVVCFIKDVFPEEDYRYQDGYYIGYDAQRHTVLVVRADRISKDSDEYPSLTKAIAFTVEELLETDFSPFGIARRLGTLASMPWYERRPYEVDQLEMKDDGAFYVNAKVAGQTVEDNS